MYRVLVCVLVAAALLAGPAAADQVSGSFESGYDRPGGDYEVFDLSSPTPTQCFSACAKDDQCLAWTYVKPGVEGDQPRCHLKNTVSAGTPDPCCTSGVMARAGNFESLRAGSAVGAPDPDHPWSRLRNDGKWCVEDIVAADYKPLFVQLSDSRATIHVFTNPTGVGYVGLSGCTRIEWNWTAFHQAWVQESIDYPKADEDPVYSKKVVYRHLNTGERVTIAYLR